MSTTERHTALAWADQIDAERRACTRGITWAQFDAAVRTHCTHDAGALADPGTEALYDQALLATRPADLDAPATVQTPARTEGPHAELGTPTQRALAIAAAIVGAAALSAWWPWGTALPLP